MPLPLGDYSHNMLSGTQEDALRPPYANAETSVQLVKGSFRRSLTRLLNLIPKAVGNGAKNSFPEGWVC